MRRQLDAPQTRPPGARSQNIDSVLAQAQELGVLIADERAGAIGKDMGHAH
jgi:hypothetical protein